MSVRDCFLSPTVGTNNCTFIADLNFQSDNKKTIQNLKIVWKNLQRSYYTLHRRKSAEKHSFKNQVKK